jgi:hypothetical protein
MTGLSAGVSNLGSRPSWRANARSTAAVTSAVLNFLSNPIFIPKKRLNAFVIGDEPSSAVLSASDPRLASMLADMSYISHISYRQARMLALTQNLILGTPTRVGRKKRWNEDMVARFPKGTFGRIANVLEKNEDRTDFVRAAVERELKRREAPGRKAQSAN